MAIWALGMCALYLAVAFGLRSLIHLRRTGSTGFRGLSGAPGSPEWIAGALFALALAAGGAAPVLDLAGVLPPLAALDGPAGHAAGFALFGLGLLATFGAQIAMGDSWRIGVSEQETTELVTGGPFALVRNPIFSAMVPSSLGLVLLVPNAVAVAGWIALIVALELQTRLVEEPYLLRVHGPRYAAYAARVGRFVPFIGRLRSAAARARRRGSA